MEDDIIEYTILDKNHVTVADIQKEVHIAWNQLHDPQSIIAHNAVRFGIEPSQLPEKLEDILSVRPSGQGLDPSTIAIIVAIINSSAVSTVAKDIWKYVILPHIRDRFGDNAIEELKKTKGK